ncbi:hypothetical protein KKA53_01700 [Candidatus Dependentiae bacterium]|nr:hypothetical protein [Candidatus Dependentiae bacterium]
MAALILVTRSLRAGRAAREDWREVIDMFRNGEVEIVVGLGAIETIFDSFNLELI